jgi:uncharacterized membrane protein YdbT with pleckstrin-like domain
MIGTEQRVWVGSPSQFKNAFSFFVAALLVLGIVFGTLVVKFWPPGIAFVGIPILYIFFRRMAVKAQVFELTSERLLTSHGVLSRTTDSLELYRVKDMRIIQPLALRMVGLENIELMTSDETSPRVVLDHIPASIHLADQIRAHVEACRLAKGTREVELE